MSTLRTAAGTQTPCAALRAIQHSSVKHRTHKHLDVTAQLTPDGMEVSTAVSRSQMSWATFDEAVFTPRHVFLFLTRRSAVIIPRRAFAGDAQWRSFVAAGQQGIALSKAAAGAEAEPPGRAPQQR